MDSQVLLYIQLKPHQIIKDYFMRGENNGVPVYLEIVQYPNDSGFYLFYFNEQKEFLTDTYHDSLEDAMAFAESDFDINRNDWQNLYKSE
jgi:hypothetical protein